MSGDYSRFTFDARRRFTAVLTQQGRVQLDSDSNEQVDLLRERTRLLSLDTGGKVWLPWDVTPNAFLVGTPGGAPLDFTLGEGRIYVDGRLAEIFPGEGATYLEQPFLPEPPPYNSAADTIVYLDLWEREVTWAEQPLLLDVALGGVDTTTRIQQVWQVKLATPPGAPVCGVDLDALFPPSAGRLTTSAVAPPAPDDPCILPPTAGYRGIENRLYRVEVQVAGPLGTSMFKWSRDNGSIVSRVSAIVVAGGQSRVTVNRIWRDQILRFRIGDWVTLTDDFRELNGESGQMARVIDIDEANRVVTLDRAVPTAGRTFGPTAADIAARNTRLQRWDEQAPLNALNTDGLMMTGPGPIELEDGVQVSFSVNPAGGSFHLGDHWVFAARTADASVEPLNAAPPRGILHHYAQLAAIPAGGPPTDCRPPKPPLGEKGKDCCTFVVAPGEDIQAAIDKLPDVGGCICLKAGLHLIDRPLLIRRDNVTLHGESQGAIIFNRRGSGLLVIAGAHATRVHDIIFRQGEQPSGDPIIYLERAMNFSMHDCGLIAMSPRRSIGVNIVSSERIALNALRIEGSMLGVWVNEGSREVVIDDSAFELAGAKTDDGISVAVLGMRCSGFVTVERCLVEQATSGIIINDEPTGLPQSRAALSRAFGNRISLVRGTDNQRSYGIDMAPAAAIVADNQIVYEGGNLTGIRIGGNGSSANGNFLRSLAQALGTDLGIALGDEIQGKFRPIERVVASGNIIEGLQHGIAVSHLSRAEILSNELGRVGDQLGNGIVLASSTDCVASDNGISGAVVGISANAGARNSIVGNRILGGGLGMFLSGEESPAVRGNRLVGPSIAGLLGWAFTGRCDIVENHVLNAASDPAGLRVGIGLVISTGTCRIEANEVRDTGLSADGATIAPTAIGIAALYVQQAQVEGNRVDYADRSKRDPNGEDRALLLQGLYEWTFNVGAGPLVLGSPVQIGSNIFAGCGRSALVELREGTTVVGGTDVFLRFERVQFLGNDCWHVGPQQFAPDAGATVSLVGRNLQVANNQVRALDRRYASYNLHDRQGPFIGNVSSGPVLGRPAAIEFPAPQGAFNMNV